MTRLTAVPAGLILLSLITCPLGAQQDDGEAKEKGWEIYMAARTAAGGGPGGPALHDYVFDLNTVVHTQDQQVQLTSRVSLIVPYLFRQEIQSGAGMTVMIFDGEKGWQKSPAGNRDLPDSSARLQRAQLDRAHVLLASPPDKALVRFLKEDEVDGAKADVIQIGDVAGSPLRLFVDQSSKDVVKIMFVGDVPGGEMAQVEEIYSDYETIGGFRWYMNRRVTRNGKEAIRSTASNFRVNVGLKPEDILR